MFRTNPKFSKTAELSAAFTNETKINLNIPQALAVGERFMKLESERAIKSIDAVTPIPQNIIDLLKIESNADYVQNDEGFINIFDGETVKIYADTQGGIAAEFCRGKIVGIHPKHRQIRKLIRTHDPGRKGLTVMEQHLQALGAVDHVTVGHQVAVFRQHHTGACGAAGGGGAGNGDYRCNGLAVDLLQRQATLLGDVLHRCRGLIQLQLNIGLRTDGNSDVLRGLYRCGGLFLVGKAEGGILRHRLRSCPEQPDIQKTEGGSDAAEKDHTDQKDRQNAPVTFRRAGAAGSIEALLPGLLLFSDPVIIIHKKPRGIIISSNSNLSLRWSNKNAKCRMHNAK